MAWGSSKAPPPPRPAPSALSKIIPLIILFIVLGAFAFIGYQIYLTTQKIGHEASNRMERKNVVFTKDGVKVGVKKMNNENYVDKTQSWLVKAWNLSTWPGYKSKLGWGEGPKPVRTASGANLEHRKPYSRSSSGK